MGKVRFEDGSYGLSFEADLEVFGHGNKVHTFWLHFVKTENKLFVDGACTFVTDERDNTFGLAIWLSVTLLMCLSMCFCVTSFTLQNGMGS
jgi:hypothetical protein